MRTVTMLVISIFAVLISSSSHSLPLKHWGFKAGYSSSALEWEHEWISDEDLSRRSGFIVGVFVEWFDYRGLSLVTCMNYEQKGTGLTSTATNPAGQRAGEITAYSRADYLSFPMFVKYAIGAGKTAPYVLAGPRVDVFLGYGKGEDDLVWGVEDKWKDVVFGLSGGFGIETVMLTSRAVFLEFVYNYDPFWLYESTNLLTGNEYRVKSNSFNISVGIGL